jgi:hypothetical protein
MSLENIAAGLFNFNPIAGLQAGTQMGAQMMQIALESQQQQLDAGAKWDQAMLSADRNALARRSQMFNEMTANLNRFDEQARQKSAEGYNSSVMSQVSGGGGGQSSVNYADLPTQSQSAMPQSAPRPPENFVQGDATGFNEAPQSAASVAPLAPAPMPIKTNQLPVNEAYSPKPIGGGGVVAEQMSFSGAEKVQPISKGVSSDSGAPNFNRELGYNVAPMTTAGVPPQMATSPTALQRSMQPYYRNEEQRQKFGQNAPAAPDERSIRLGQAPAPTLGNFRFDMRTRDEIGRESVEGSRLIALDYNSSKGVGNYAMIVIPDNASQQEREAANLYVNRVTDWFRQNGVNYGNPYVKTTSENAKDTGRGGGMGGYFHTEPAFAENTAAMKILRDKAPEYAKILAETLGGISGATFIPPHKKNDPGASANGFPGERDFARQYIMPHLSKMAGGGMVGNLTAYSPRRGASNVFGAGGEGGYESSVPGPDGKAEVRTLDDFANGRSPYITISGNPDFFGRKYKIPSIPFEDANGNVRRLENVPAVVHDTGSAFAGAPEGRFELPIARDASNMLMNKNHARWKSEGVTFLPGTEDRPQSEKVGTAPATPAQAVTMQGGAPQGQQQYFGPVQSGTVGGGASQAQQLYGYGAAQQQQQPQPQQPDYSQIPEYRALTEAETALQSTTAEKVKSTQELAGLRQQQMMLQAGVASLDRTDPAYRIQAGKLQMEAAKIQSQISTAEERNNEIKQRETKLTESLLNAQGAWKIVKDQQDRYAQYTPEAGPKASRSDVIDAYLDATPRERLKMEAEFADDTVMSRAIDRAKDFEKEQNGTPSQTFKIGTSEYTLRELAEYSAQGGDLEENPVRDFVNKDPKLKQQVEAFRAANGMGTPSGAPAATQPPAAAPGTDPVKATIDEAFKF